MACTRRRPKTRSVPDALVSRGSSGLHRASVCVLLCCKLAGFAGSGEDEQLAIDMDGLPEGSALPKGPRASGYGEITLSGGRALTAGPVGVGHALRARRCAVGHVGEGGRACGQTVGERRRLRGQPRRLAVPGRSAYVCGYFCILVAAASSLTFLAVHRESCFERCPTRYA